MKTKPTSAKTTVKGKELLKTEPPISDKDEVKKAEDKSRSTAKKKL